jgi:hypothetical protein
MKHSHDGKWPDGGVDHEVGKHQPEFDRQRREVLTLVSRLRVRCEQMEGFGDFLQDVTGEAPAALGDEVIPDFAEVVSGFGR